MATRPDDLIYGVAEAFAYGLADFLTNVYPDRLEGESKSARSTVGMWFRAQGDVVAAPPSQSIPASP